MKKLMALLLALVMATALCVPALAADAATTGDNSIKLTDGAAGSEALGSKNQAGTGGNSNTTEITGTIKATQLKVTVPTVVAFDIDPTIEATAVDSQITAQSDKITITNGSIVPIWVKVSNVAVAMVVTPDSGVTHGTAPKLVNKWPDSETVGTDRTLMFAIKTDGDKPTDFGTSDSAAWLVGKEANGTGVPTATYYVDDVNSGKLGQTGTTGDGDAVTMKIYGRTGKNWMAGEKFTITPTFTVSVKPYST